MRVALALRPLLIKTACHSRSFFVSHPSTVEKGTMGVPLSVRLTRVLSSLSLVRFAFRGAAGDGFQDTLRYPFDDGLQGWLVKLHACLLVC